MVLVLAEQMTLAGNGRTNVVKEGDEQECICVCAFVFVCVCVCFCVCESELIGSQQSKQIF